MESLGWVLKLVDSVSGPAAKMAKGLKGFGEELKEGGSALSGLGDNLSAFTDEVSGAIEAAKEVAAAIAGIAGKAYAFGKFVTDAAAFKQQTLQALGIIEGSSEAANSTFATIETMANNAGVPTADVVELYKQLRAAGFAAKDAQNILAGGLDVGAVFGKGSGDAVTESIKNMKELGKFDLKNVKGALKQANIPLEELEKTLAAMKGKTVAQIKQMMASGQITADEGITALLKTIQTKVDKGGPLGSATKDIVGGSIQGQVQALKNTFASLFEDSTLAEPLKNALKTINELLGANSATGKKLRELLGGALSFITDLLKQILTSENIAAVFDAVLDVANALRSAFKAVWPYIQAIAGPMWDGIKDAVRPLIAAFKKLFGGEGGGGPNPQLIEAFKDLGTIIGWVVGVMVDMIAITIACSTTLTALLAAALAVGASIIHWIVEKVSDAIDSISDFIDGISDAASDLYDSAIDIAGNFIDGMIQGIKDGWDSVVETVTNLAGAVVDTVEDTLGIASPSKVMAKMGGFTAAGFAKGIDDGTGDVSGAAGNLAQAPIGAVGGGGGGGGAAAGGARGGVTIGDIVVHVPEGTKDAQKFGAVVGAEIRAQVLAVFEELGLQSGAIDTP